MKNRTHCCVSMATLRISLSLFTAELTVAHWLNWYVC